MTKKSINIKSFLSILSIFLLLAFLIFIFKGIILFFSSQSLSKFELFVEAKAISNFIFCVSLALLFFRNISLNLLGGSALVSLGMAEIFFFEDFAYNISKDYGLVQPSSNSQWPRVIFASTAIIFSFIRLISKKERTLDRTFFHLASWIVVITTLLFHRVTAQGALRSIENEKRVVYIENMSKNFSQFSNFCQKEKILCFENGSLIKTDKSQGLFAQDRSNIISYEKNGSLSGLITFVNEEQNVFLVRNGPRSVLDLWDYNNKKMEQVNIFYFLSICAHTFWSLLAIVLSFFHRKENIRLMRKFFSLKI